ncbi:MAG: hypothetical protein HYV39_00200 [Candidatus Levybacteria bacterium]|nr:hypothetical protein [Candidatus Levybacteria bacterium]
MNKSYKLLFLKETFDQNTLRILYYKNRMYFVPLMLILVTIFLFVFAVVPQIQTYFNLRGEEDRLRKNLGVLNNNFSLLLNLSEKDLDSKLEKTISALPPEKDFGGILRVISRAGSSASVTLGDFSLQIGELSLEPAKVVRALPIEITLTINDGVSAAKRFSQELSSRLPLAEVTNIKSAAASSTITVVFYYQPFSPLPIDKTKNLQPMSKEAVSLFNQLSSFKSEQ